MNCPNCKSKDRVLLLVFTAVILIGAFTIRLIDQAADINEAEKYYDACAEKVRVANILLSQCRPCEGKPVNLSEVLG